MLSIEYGSAALRVIADGCTLLSSADTHFVTAVRKEKTYTSVRGSVKESVVERERIPLGSLTAEGEGVFIFSGGGHAVRAEIRECELGCEIALSGKEGWGYEFSFPAIEGEAIFGGGEQYRKTNLRGERVVNFVSEHIKAETLIEKTLLPRKLYREKSAGEIGSYSPMPIFVSDRGRLWRFDTSADGSAQFGEGCYLFSFDRCPEKLTLLKADSYDALCRALALRTPPRMGLPAWCTDGMILGVQGGTQVVLDKVFAMLDAGAKICGVWCQDWSGELRTVMGKQVWWNWEVSEQLYPDLRGAIKKLNERGVQFLAYINPYLVKGSRLYDECAARGWLIRRGDGSIYHIKSTTFDAGMLDLTDPEAVRYIKDVLIKKNMLDLGVRGWMADFGEYLPTDCVLHEGDAKLLHNLWPVIWARINREAIDEYGADDAMFFSRSGYIGIQQYAPIMWNGDQHTDTTKDYGMPCVMPASFSLGFSGVPLVHCDIGGFFSFARMRRDDELFVRWMEMGCFSPLMRSHESIRPWANSQFDAPAVVPHTVRLTTIHASLRPYIERCLEQAKDGIPAIRPDFWPVMDYGESRDEYSYFLGDELYVCPVIERHADRRRVHLPAGEWTGLWDGRSYSGGETFTVDAPLGKSPVFYRSNGEFAPLFRAAAAL